MKFRHRSLIIISGLVWLSIGIFLLTLGLNFIFETVQNPDIASLQGRFSFLGLAEKFIENKQNAIAVLITFALFLGYIKGRTVLAKTANKQVQRIMTLPNPASIKYLYTKGQLLLIGLMITLGISMRFFPITTDTRGVVDIAIGFALINGGILFFRSAINFQFLKNKG